MTSAGGEAVPLSEHEQRLLEQIERALYAEDPKFASTVRGGRMRRPTKRRRMQGIVVFAVGLVLLIAGIAVTSLNGNMVFLALSGVGFLAMLGGALLAINGGGAPAQPTQAKDAEPDRNRFTGRMEERFRRRFEQE